MIGIWETFNSHSVIITRATTASANSAQKQR